MLELVAEGGVHSHTDLARELGVSEGLLAQMLRDLEQMGYLKQVSTECGAHCTGCPMSSECAVGRPGRVWALTEKGSRPVQDREAA